MKPSNVVATPISGVYKAPLSVELDCPSVKVEPTSAEMELNTDAQCVSRNISKVGNNLYFNAKPQYSSLPMRMGIYNVRTKATTFVDCPYDTSYASFIYVNNAVYIIGGAARSTAHGKIMKYTTGVVSMPVEMPQAISKMSCNAIGNYIYIIGGYANKSLSTIYRLDTTTDTIKEMDYSLSVACSDSSSAVYQNRYIYVVAGEKVQIIDTLEGTVDYLTKDLPVSRYGSGAMIKDDYLYVFGGRDSSTDNEIYKKYLLDDRDWELSPEVLKHNTSRFGYTSDEKGYYHITIGNSNAKLYETGRFGVPSSDIEIRYTQTEDGTIPADPTQEDTLYTAPIELTSPTKHNIKAKAFYVGE